MSAVVSRTYTLWEERQPILVQKAKYRTQHLQSSNVAWKLCFSDTPCHKTSAASRQKFSLCTYYLLWLGSNLASHPAGKGCVHHPFCPPLVAILVLCLCRLGFAMRTATRGFQAETQFPVGKLLVVEPSFYCKKCLVEGIWLHFVFGIITARKVIFPREWALSSVMSYLDT